MRSFLLCTAALGAAAVPLSAQATFTQVVTAQSPPPAGGTVGVTNGAGLLVFGGLVSTAGNVFTYSDRLWYFDGLAWTDVSPAGTLPPARHFYGGAWDIARQRYVLFGGQNSLNASSTAPDLNDTWEWDGNSWTQLTPANAPSPRRWAAMFYHTGIGRTVLFGGNTASGANTAASYSNETWTWDGGNWTLLTPATSPSPRARGFFGFDPTSNAAIYYGGRNTGALGDTWRFDGFDWTQLTTNPGPGSAGVPGLFAYGATYDLLRGRHVIYGGTRTGGTLAATWEFDGVATWVDRGAQVGGPASRTGCSLSYVPALAASVLWGGFQTAFLGDTWTYQTDDLAVSQPVGTGCAGTVGVPQLTDGNAPWAGDLYQLACTGLSPAGVAFATIGFSTTSWSLGALPFPLAALTPSAGAGCNLLVSPDAFNLLGNSAGTANLAIPLPNSAAFAGLQIAVQVAQLELVPSERISVSNGYQATIGVR